MTGLSGGGGRSVRDGRGGGNLSGGADRCERALRRRRRRRRGRCAGGEEGAR